MGLLHYIKRILFGKKVLKSKPTTRAQAELATKEPEQIIKDEKLLAPKKISINITIGLDFGTSTTKCIVNFEGQDNGKDKFLAIAFPNRESKDGTLGIPTAIGIEDDTMLFGFDAEHLSEDKIIRSFKMAIPCMEDGWNDFKSPFMIRNKSGYFEIFGHEVSALDLSILYISVVIKQIKKQLALNMKGSAEIHNVYLNMAAPLDQLKRYYEVVEKATKQNKNEILFGNVLRDIKLFDHYMELGQWSLRLSDISQERWKVEEALTALNAVKKNGVVPFEDSPAYVLPESVAAISAYVNRPRTRQGKFISFDVGAGTTDISVFWLQKQHGSPKPSYYSSGSLHLGMDEIDVSLSDILPETEDCSLREKREKFENTDVNLMKYKDRWNPILTKITQHKNKVFGLAYEKDKIPAHWGDQSHANVTLLMLGGGCQSSILQNIPYMSLWDNFIGRPLTEILGLDFTKEVVLPDGNDTILSEIPSLSKQANLLVVAEGLAQKIIEIPDFDITTEPIFIRPQITRETYLTGHWW